MVHQRNEIVLVSHRSELGLALSPPGNRLTFTNAAGWSYVDILYLRLLMEKRVEVQVKKYIFCVKKYTQE